MALRTMSSEQARTQWRTLLDLASQAGVDIVIERHGQATAAVISYESYRAIQATLAEIRAGATAEQRGVSMAAILEQLAGLPGPGTIADPLDWQAQQRRERDLPGRGNGC